MQTNSAGGPRYSIVVPVFNEQAVLPVLLRRLDLMMGALDGVTETIFVDDGSSDCSAIILRAKAKDDPRYRFIGLSRNFGHQAAITAGMDAASGDAVIVMDADLQDPPEVVGQMIEKVLEAFCAMPEQERFVRGMFAWLGFRQTEVAFHRLPRLAGETKYPLFKMLRLAANGVIGFSDAPLRLAIWGGFAVSAFAAIYAMYVGVEWLAGDRSLVAGWASTIIIVSFLSGINMIMTGIMGLYVGRIYAEVKRRPLYVVSEKTGFDRAAAAPAMAEPAATRKTA